MRRPTFETALTAYLWLYVTFIVWASVRTLLSAAHGEFGAVAQRHFIYALAGTEVVAALGLLFHKVELAAAVMLALVYLVAIGHGVLEGVFPAHIVFYAATLAFLVYSRRAPAPNAASR